MEIVSLNQISPDQVIIWSWSFIMINATILYTWLVMAILVVGSWFITRNLVVGNECVALAAFSGSDYFHHPG